MTATYSRLRLNLDQTVKTVEAFFSTPQDYLRFLQMLLHDGALAYWSQRP